jgi:hypothetical protein
LSEIKAKGHLITFEINYSTNNNLWQSFILMATEFAIGELETVIKKTIQKFKEMEVENLQTLYLLSMSRTMPLQKNFIQI